MEAYSKGNREIVDRSRDVIEILESLNSAVTRAGGEIYTLKRLEEISAAELLCTLSTNRVRFRYIPKE